MSDSMNSQPMPTRGIEPVNPQALQRVQDVFEKQEARGVKKYGITLHTHNGRDAGQDAMEEAIDLIKYLTQLRMEHEDAKVLLQTVFVNVQRSVENAKGYEADKIVKLLYELLSGQAPDYWLKPLAAKAKAMI